ncbi:MAG: hypothetical protein ACO3UU_05620 [Minisyncoccia bacterium]
MINIFNKDGFIWWVGVVEDRYDPERLGRCKVRIFGYHTANKTLLPTKDLPWCVPIQPITSAAMSGIGTTPLGPVEGTWVVGFFLDGSDGQQPAMFGTIAAKISNNVNTFTSPVVKPTLSNTDTGVQIDEVTNEVVTDDQGTPVPAPTPVVSGWKLGQTSKTYESGNKGPGTINDYTGGAGNDLGGASYGSYQLASFLPNTMKNGKARPVTHNPPIIQFINFTKFKDKFKKLTPATPAFDNKWKEIANEFPSEFELEQYLFIKQKYYFVLLANLQRQGLDLSTRGPSVQDLIWSTAVQLGPGTRSVNTFLTPLRGLSNLSDSDIVRLVSDYKIASVNEHFKSSTTQIRNSVRNRYVSEKSSLLGLITTTT